MANEGAALLSEQPNPLWTQSKYYTAHEKHHM
jgi:hypothetical protein